MNQLAETSADERPDWIPEGIWTEVKRALILYRAKVDKRQLEQIAASFGIPFPKFKGMYRNGRWRQQLDEAREDFVQSNIVARYTLADALHTKMQDPEAMAKMSVKDLTIASKAVSDDTLNLANGAVGSPALQMNFADIKVLLGTPPQKPE